MRALLLPFVLVVLGCSEVPMVTAASLAQQARDNPILVQRDFANRRFLHLQGSVQSVSMGFRETVQVYGGYGAAHGYKGRESLPVVVLEPGSVLCYFEPDRIDDAATIKKGELVDLRCVFDSVRDSEIGVLTVLGNCKRWW